MTRGYRVQTHPIADTLDTAGLERRLNADLEAGWDTVHLVPILGERAHGVPGTLLIVQLGPAS